MQAYSLLELLLAITLLTIILFTAAPMWGHLLQSGALATQGNKIAAAVEYTRILAIKRGHSISLCRSFGAGAPTDWSKGQIIKDDTSGAILRVFAAASQRNKLLWNSSFSKNDCIAFTPLGLPNGQQGSFYYCSQDGRAGASRIVVQETGNVSVQSLDAEEATEVCAQA